MRLQYTRELGFSKDTELRVLLIMNAGGNSSIAADVQDNLSENYIPDAKIIVGFSIICTASYFFAQFFPTLKLPKITGACARSAESTFCAVFFQRATVLLLFCGCVQHGA